MAKEISAYRGFTASAIKTRASCPNQADIAVNGSIVACTGLTWTKIKNAILGDSYKLGELSLSETVNPWSGFGPTARTIDNLQIVNAPVAPHGAGEFAGYNHSAITPGWQAGALATASAGFWINAGERATIAVNVNVGEVRYSDDLPVSGITLALYNNVGNLVGWGSRNFYNDSVQNDVTMLQATVNYDMSIAETLTGKIWLVADTSQFDDSQHKCFLPNTEPFDININIKATTIWQYSGGGQSAPVGWSISGAGLNTTTGVWSAGIITSSSNHAALRILVTMTDWLGNYVGSGYIYNYETDGPYEAMTDIVPSGVYLGVINIEHGYNVVVQFLY